MKVSLHPEAVEDLREAAKFYRERAGADLSRSLVDEFERSLKVLRTHPGIGGVWRGEMRRFAMKRFPYSLIYLVSEEEIRVLAVAHHSRRPGYWRERK